MPFSQALTILASAAHSRDVLSWAFVAAALRAVDADLAVAEAAAPFRFALTAITARRSTRRMDLLLPLNGRVWEALFAQASVTWLSDFVALGVPLQ